MTFIIIKISFEKETSRTEERGTKRFCLGMDDGNRIRMMYKGKQLQHYTDMCIICKRQCIVIRFALFETHQLFSFMCEIVQKIATLSAINHLDRRKDDILVHSQYMQCFISCADESNTYVKLTTVYSCVHIRANHSMYVYVLSFFTRRKQYGSQLNQI